MVDPDILARRILSLNEALQHLQMNAADLTMQRLADDAMLQAAIERWLQVAIEACIDAAYHLVAEGGWTPPDNARGALATLGAHGVIPPDLAQRLGSAAGMRNILVHDYAAIDRSILIDVVKHGLGDLRAFGAALGDVLARASDE